MIKQAQVQIILLAISIFVCEPLPYPEQNEVSGTSAEIPY